MSFETNITNMRGEAGIQWLNQLPRLVEIYAKRWKLSDLKPVDNLTYNYVLTGYRDSLPVVLKLGFEALEIRKEARALEAFESGGAVKVLEQEDNQLLLERLIPGYSLKNWLPTRHRSALKVMCEISQKLHCIDYDLSIGSFPHIKDHLNELENCFSQPTKISEMIPESTNVFLQYLERAIELKNRLINNSWPETLLHGDLHHDNILWDGSNWRLIDPKGIIGWSVNEFWAFVIDIEEDTKDLAKFFDLDLRVVREWYFVQLALSICWSIQDNIPPSPLFKSLIKKAFDLIR